MDGKDRKEDLHETAWMENGKEHEKREGRWRERDIKKTRGRQERETRVSKEERNGKNLDRKEDGMG